MLLKKNEILFQDFEWTTNGDAKIPDSNVTVVSPYFNLNTSLGDSNTFRFAIRLLGNSSIFDKFQTIVYCYVHNADQLGIEVKAVECAIGGKTIPLHLKVEETIIKVFKSEDFLTYDHLSEKGISLKYRLHITNISDQPFGYVGYELRDTCFGEEMWSAAQKGVMTDCEFVVQHQTFLAHKAIVASRCPGLAERIGHENNNQIEIHDVTNPVVFKALLYFLYTGQILPLDSSNQWQFVDLAKDYQVKMIEQFHAILERSVDRSQELPKLINAIQPKVKHDLTVEIRENHGSIAEIGRGIFLHYDFIRSFKAEDTIASETFRFEQGGFFCVTLVESSTHKNGHNYQLTFSSFHLLSGFKLDSVSYSKNGSADVTMSKVFEEDGEALKLFREEFILPRHSDNSPYYVHIHFTVHLTETDERWGYRLHDPLLPVQFWSASRRKILTDVELRAGDRMFYAHRAILSARSSVFAAMFGNDTSDTGIIEIEDIGAEVFEDFLVFLYTGRLRTTKNLEQLWVAANKYNVKTLEHISEPIRARSGIEDLSVKLLSSL